MTANDKLIALVGLLTTAPVTLMVLIEPEQAALFGRIFIATLLGMFGL